MLTVGVSSLVAPLLIVTVGLKLALLTEILPLLSETADTYFELSALSVTFRPLTTLLTLVATNFGVAAKTSLLSATVDVNFVTP